MADNQEYRFKIGKFSPKTIPLGRLLEYLAQFKRLFSDSDRVHLLSVNKGSAMPVFYVEPDFEDRFTVDAKKAAKGLGTDIQNQAYLEINYMAADDNTTAEILSPDGAEIIPFPGMPRPVLKEPEVIEGIEEAANLFASVYKLGRPNSKANKYEAWFSNLKNGNVIRAEMSVALGVKMAAHMEQELAINGIASWTRNEVGKWVIDKITVKDFSEFEPKHRGHTFEAIKKAKDVLPKDIQDRLTKHRRGSDNE